MGDLTPGWKFGGTSLSRACLAASLTLTRRVLSESRPCYTHGTVRGALRLIFYLALFSHVQLTCRRPQILWPCEERNVQGLLCVAYLPDRHLLFFFFLCPVSLHLPPSAWCNAIIN